MIGIYYLYSKIIRDVEVIVCHEGSYASDVHGASVVHLYVLKQHELVAVEAEEQVCRSGTVVSGTLLVQKHRDSEQIFLSVDEVGLVFGGIFAEETPMVTAEFSRSPTAKASAITIAMTMGISNHFFCFTTNSPPRTLHFISLAPNTSWNRFLFQRDMIVIRNDYMV